MKPNTENMKVSVQETVDELFSAHRIPFKLTAYKVTMDGLGGHVAFYDSRLTSVRFPWNGGPLKEVVRAAILDRVNGLGFEIALPHRGTM